MIANPKQTAENSAWLVRGSPQAQARLRLFCFPHAGVGAAIYTPWRALLPPSIELCAIVLPGREGRMRESAYTRLAPLVADLASALEPMLDRPYAIFGHSIGALLGFELARELRRRAAPEPVHLFASARRAPHLRDADPPLYRLSDTQLVEEMQRRYNGIPAVILADRELLSLFLPVMRADVTLADTYLYTPEPPLTCPISALGGDGDHRVSHEELGAWRTHTRSSFGVQLFPGDHFYLQTARAPLIELIAGALSGHLDS
ncbi:MAG: thioesterase [Chloroflexales bacterium]|nr:thioesterase [Chloroflexales bacterium]